MKVSWKMLAPIVGVVLVLFAISFFAKYRTSDVMPLPVEEIEAKDYPEDPSYRSAYYSRYGQRQLKLVDKENGIFDFIFESKDPKVATISFKHINLKLLLPIQPAWTRKNSGLEIITLVEREWNRQQIAFAPNSPHLEISGGDGFEKKQLHSAELSRNCLNAGLWEIQLFTKENEHKTLYYQGWFDFPLGHYKKIFEAKNNTSYWWHWYRLEHWVDPEGIVVSLNTLRSVDESILASASYNPKEPILVQGEQVRKKRTWSAPHVHTWEDLTSQSDIHFASFLPPGRYQLNSPWGHQLQRFHHFDKAIVRKVRSPASQRQFMEIELIFRNSPNGNISRFIVSGFNPDSLPRLQPEEYPKGWYMPMGISVPPFYQTYDALKQNPPYLSPYFSVLLDANDRWLNHHAIGVDGPVMHRDSRDPSILHLYLLSYERHTLIKHIVVHLPNSWM